MRDAYPNDKTGSAPFRSPARLDVIIASAVALLAGFIFYPFASIGVDPHHDGIMLKPALDVFSGQVIFRDSFSQYGPLTTYLQALVLRIQPTLLSLRLLTVAAYAGSLFFLYLAWRSILPRSLGVVASIIFIISAPFLDPFWGMLPWSSVLALFFQSVAIFALLRIVAGHAIASYSWTLGIACACTFLCRQPVGIILTGSVAVIAVALHGVGWRSSDGASWRVWGRVATGFGVIMMLILGHLAIYGAIGAWWEQNILWPSRWASGIDKRNMPFLAGQYLRLDYATILLVVLLFGWGPPLFRLYLIPRSIWIDFVWWGILVVGYLFFVQLGDISWLLLPNGGWAGLILGLICLQSLLVLVTAIRNRPKVSGYYILAAFSVLALGSAVQVYPLPDPNHIYWALAPGFGIFVYFCWRCSGAKILGCGLFLLLLMIPAAYYKYVEAKVTFAQPLIKLDSPPSLCGMKVNLPLAQALQRIDAVIKPLLASNSDRAGLLYGDDALYLTWFKNPVNPSPYYVAWAGLIPQMDQLQRLNFLAEQKPVLFLHKYGVNSLEEMGVVKLLQAVNYRILHSELELSLFIAVPADPKPVTLSH